MSDVAIRAVELRGRMEHFKRHWPDPDVDLDPAGDRPSCQDPLASIPRTRWNLAPEGPADLPDPIDWLRSRLVGVEIDKTRWSAVDEYCGQWRNWHAKLSHSSTVLDRDVRAQLTMLRGHAAAAAVGRVEDDIARIELARVVADGMSYGMQFAACAVAGVRVRLEQEARGFVREFRSRFPDLTPAQTVENYVWVYHLVGRYARGNGQNPRGMDYWLLPLDRRIAELAALLEWLAENLLPGGPGRPDPPTLADRQRFVHPDPDVTFAEADGIYRPMVERELAHARRRAALNPDDAELQSRIRAYQRMLQPDTVITYFDPLGVRGDGAAAVAILPRSADGEILTLRDAANIGTYFPGTAAELGDLHVYMGTAEHIVDGAGPGNAMFVVLGDLPDNLGQAVNNTYAIEQRDGIIEFQARLHEYAPDARLVGFGYSYGGSTLGTSMVGDVSLGDRRVGAYFNDVYHMSSAGLGVGADEVGDYRPAHGGPARVFSATVEAEGPWVRVPGLPPIPTYQPDAIVAAQIGGNAADGLGNLAGRGDPTLFHGVDPDTAPGSTNVYAGHIPTARIADGWNPYTIHVDYARGFDLNGQRMSNPQIDAASVILRGEGEVVLHHRAGDEGERLRLTPRSGRHDQ